MIGNFCYSNGDTNPGNECERCDVNSGPYQWSPAPEKAPCTDANKCTGNDQCVAGVCVGSAFDVGLICNDGNLCTTDSCVPALGCQSIPNTLPCADDGVECTQSVCNNGACTHPLEDEGASCDDDDACTINEQCSNGACVGQPYAGCNDDLACTTDSCNGGGPTPTCNNDFIAGNCLIENKCYAQGQASASNPCKICDTATSNHAWSNAPNGTDCGYFDFQAGWCEAGFCNNF